MFDITFFFFVIVILLAILQGLIIDAFGELRGQLQAVSDKMEEGCFICGDKRDYFDRVPRGFEQHVLKEHNFANVSLVICLFVCFSHYSSNLSFFSIYFS